ncbi:major facilitator superfamily transporter [Trichoderma harzianum]|uniref:Major facilitator superfamily transporter n=1 Tax=Trichoderma harzianum TaxID=5544 RepID=A0A0F9XBZ4_TRIHA|nr:major facilitator superfamily transporter [Trichoderma harzianum]
MHTTETKDSTSNNGADVEKHETMADVDVGKHEAIGVHDGDEAMAAFRDGQIVDVDEDTNRRLLRKIDRHILPIMCTVYCMNYLDKTTLSYASIMGLKEDIHLRLPIAKYSGFCVICWGVTLALFAVIHDFKGAAIIRFLLGAFESAVTPGWALITSQWYKRSEQGSRTGLWFSFNGFAQIFGGVIAYGIAGHSLFVLGIIFLIVVPDNQLKSRWLNETDRVLAVARVRVNQQGIGNKHFKTYQFKEALMDPLAWAFAFYSIAANIPNGGISNFFSQLIVSFGYSPTQSLLLGTPAGAVQVVSLLLSGWYGDKYKNRLLVSLGGLSLAVLGAILLVALPDAAKAGKLVGYYLTLAGTTPFVALLSLISSNIAGYTKKTTVAAMYLIFYCAGNIIGPQTFRPADAPSFIPAKVTILVCYVLCMIDVIFIWWYCRRMNQKKASLRAEPGYVTQENSE